MDDVKALRCKFRKAKCRNADTEGGMVPAIPHDDISNLLQTVTHSDRAN